MKPQCMKCKHFFITHNPKTPRACRVYKIQSKDLPSQIVKLANGGVDCIGFESKPEKKQPKNLNDSKYW